MNTDNEKKLIFKGNYYLKLLLSDNQIIINATDGVAKIAYQLLPGEKNINDFKWIDSDFKKLTDNQLVTPTKTTEVGVYNLLKTATFKEVINSILVEPDELCLTQSQIIDFCVNQKAFIKKKCYGTVFLIKSDQEFYFVRAIKAIDERITFCLHSFTCETKWDRELDLNFVFPACI